MVLLDCWRHGGFLLISTFAAKVLAYSKFLLLVHDGLRSEAPASFLVRLEKGSTEVPMEASDVRVETEGAEAPASSNLGPSVGPSLPPPGVP